MEPRRRQNNEQCKCNICQKIINTKKLTLDNTTLNEAFIYIQHKIYKVKNGK
jgi:hypothetical protein